MKPEELAKLMLDLSIKEAELFWKRNTEFFVGQVVLFGFAANILTKTGGSMTFAILMLLVTAGVIIAILHRMVLETSEHYNGAWYQGFDSWVTEQAVSETDINLKASWLHLKDVIETMDRLDRKKLTLKTWQPNIWEKNVPLYHSSRIAKWIPIIFFFLWLSLGIVASFWL